ncbi:MAG: DUF899 domain-containing protein [Polyangiales bacterium]
MNENKMVVAREEWIVARKALLAREKAFTHERDALSAARRALPMVKIDEPYVFEERSGKRTLADLFDGRKQLVVYHFMFDPSWDAGCKSCSFVADNFAGSIVHLAAANTSFAVISRAPLAKIEPFRERMGWRFRWLSSFGSDFNYDFHVSFRPEEMAQKSVDYNYVKQPFGSPEAPGVSVFLREGDDVFHTYSTYGRGLDLLIGTYNYLDLTPLGRQEERPMAWVRHHDKYEPR